MFPNRGGRQAHQLRLALHLPHWQLSGAIRVLRSSKYLQRLGLLQFDSIYPDQDSLASSANEAAQKRKSVPVRPRAADDFTRD